MAESWVIRNAVTGETVCETWSKAIATRPLKPGYECVPVLQHLQELNRPGTPAYNWARREENQR